MPDTIQLQKNAKRVCQGGHHNDEGQQYGPTMRRKMRLGVISALSDEQQGLVEAMQGMVKVSYGMRDYMSGNLWGIDAVCVLSRLGKVAAAMTAAILVEKFEVTHIVFTGVAGSADACVRVGDLVRPLFPRFQVPLTGLSHFQACINLSDVLGLAASAFLNQDLFDVIDADALREFGITSSGSHSGLNTGPDLKQPRLHHGLLGSGDQFINNRAHLDSLKQALPGLLAVEMEGAAVAQVCFELGIPFAVIRTISDDASEGAAFDFMRFVQTVASTYAFCIIKRLCQHLAARG
jgi:adenosylhomocysteine nucleosidase